MLSKLNDHGKDPNRMWGRYLTSTSATCVIADSDTNSELDEVCLIPTSPPPTITKSCKLTESQPIEIIPVDDDKDYVSLRSNMDRNPKEFHAQMANFVIPKTRNQTRSENHGIAGKWIATGQQEKVVGGVALSPCTQGRPRRSINSEEKPVKLKRSWQYAESPRNSAGDVSVKRNMRNGTRSSQLSLSKRFRPTDNSPLKGPLEVKVHIVDLKSSMHCSMTEKLETIPETIQEPASARSLQEEVPCSSDEETRCLLCDGVINKYGCLTCPKSSADELSVCKSLDTSEEEGLIDSKSGCTDHPKYELSNARILNSPNTANGKTCEAQTSEDTHESDNIESPPEETPRSNVTQDDLFCPLCNKARTGNGCACSTPKSNAVKFYRRAKRSSCKKYCGTTYKVTSKMPSKRLKPLTMKKTEKKKNVGSKCRISDEETLTNSEEEKKKEKSVPVKEPECVHISSDEEETPDNTTRSLEHKDYFKPSENEQTEEDSGCNEITNLTKKRSLTCVGDSSKDLPKEQASVTVKRKAKKKGVQKGCFGLDETDASMLLVVKIVLVGQLMGTPTEPVELNEERILIRIKFKNEQFAFKIEKNNLASFKIHSESKPLIVILTPTSGWARKYVERYRELGIFIDPGSAKYFEKHITLLLSEEIKGESLEALTELVDLNLSDEPIVKTMSDEEAMAERENIVKTLDQFVKNKPSSTDKPLSSANTPLSSPDKPSSSPDKPSSSSDKPSSSPDKPSSSPDKPSSSADKPSSSADKPSLSIDELLSSNSAVSNTSCVNVNNKCNEIVKRYSTRSRTAASIPKQPPKTILVYQPSNKLDGVTITSEDMLCLEPNTYLNDVIIDFFLKYLIEEKLTPKDRERLHIFSTFFYNRLTQKPANSDGTRNPTTMHGLVKSWTKNVDIFSKDFLVVPINEHSHWYLIIICFPRMVAERDLKVDNSCDDKPNAQTEDKEKDCENGGFDDSDDFDDTLFNFARCRKTTTKSPEQEIPLKARPCILVFDSLGNTRHPRVLYNLRNYLNCEWKERKDSSIKNMFDKDTLKGCYPKVPCQENFSDCGLYVLQYFESFFTDPVEDYTFPINLQSWFPSRKMAAKRQYITNLIYELQAKAESKLNG